MKHVGTKATSQDLADQGQLGSAAALNHGTSPGNLVRLDPATGKLPAVDASLLTNLPAGSLSPVVKQITSTMYGGF